MQKSNLLILIFSLSCFQNLEAKLIPIFQAPEAIYGIDDRSLINLAPKAIKTLAQSVAMIVDNDLVVKDDCSQIVVKATPLKESIGLCENERYGNELSASPACTGFLVTEDLLVTAGHCIESADDCEKKSIVFDVYSSDHAKKGFRVSSKALYRCQALLAHNSLEGRDYSLIKLDRIVRNRKPLKLNLRKEMLEGSSVFMLGHPLGLPMIWSKSAPVKIEGGLPYFKATLDSFEGNSGAPVFNAKTLEVEGILVRGQEDFLKDEEKECYRYQKFDNNETSQKAEEISKINDLLPFLSK